MSSLNSIIGGSRGLGDLARVSTSSSGSGGSVASSAAEQAGIQDRSRDIIELSKG